MLPILDNYRAAPAPPPPLIDPPICCTVAPGFEFEDFELAEAGELMRRYPGQRERIMRMRRPGE